MWQMTRLLVASDGLICHIWQAHCIALGGQMYTSDNSIKCKENGSSWLSATSENAHFPRICPRWTFFSENEPSRGTRIIRKLISKTVRIFLTIEGGVPKYWYLPTSPFHYAYKMVSQMFQFIVKNGICYLHFLQHDTPFDQKVPPNEKMMLNFRTA